MTKEQETIAKLEEYISIYEQLKCNIQPSEVNAIETVLSMLKEKDKIMKNKEEFYKKLSEDNDFYAKELEKKDKIIYEIIKEWKQDDIRSIEEIIKYFEEKVENNSGIN